MLNSKFTKSLLLSSLLSLVSLPAAEPPALEQGWANPPTSARLRAYWWWLNGQVTKQAISRDLQEMKAKGFGGALICDAGGAEQDGNDRVPPGPTFFSPEWRELYKHTLREADRLGLEMSLNIQSGWNLGGPMVTADDAAKKLVWSETRLTGPGNFAQKLAQPKGRDGYYRDLFVVAYPVNNPTNTEAIRLISVTASSFQTDHPPQLAVDASTDTFWVSGSAQPGQGPTRDRPAWLQFHFSGPITVDALVLRPRPGYGPRDCELQVSKDGQSFTTVKTFAASEKSETKLSFGPVSAPIFRLAMFGSFDPLHPDKPRNVQVAELQLSGNGKTWPASAVRSPIKNWEQKALHRALHFSAPDTTPLFEDLAEQPGQEDTQASQVIDLTSKLAPDGTLRWEIPAGTWQILRFGCALGDRSRVSTSSDGWKGYALDVLDAGAFQRYWNAVVEPLITDAGPFAGRSLKYLHTDSWEVDAINWTPTLREEFRARRGYDFFPYLPVIVGRVVDSRKVSNRFLHDFRKTLGDLAVDNHFRLFRDGAHRHGLQIHPESGGPHAVPIDAQRCLGWNDVPMSEFWAWSWRHRVGDSNRFFVKQPASAAHTCGRRLVAAEGFTTIGPHWQETLWDNLKPSFDQAACEGLNLLVWHAFVCSPAELGLPGIQYFAGTHFNPNTTWWSKSEPFLAYINRCQFLLQQGLFVADSCYYYGDHVPNFSQLKRSDPARILPGYDYDVVTEETLLTSMAVRDNRLTLPDGMSYRVLVLPNRPLISLPVLQKIKQLVAAGATIVGLPPREASTLRDFPDCDTQVQNLATELWGPADTRASGLRSFGKGRIAWNTTARQLLLKDGIQPDFESAADSPAVTLDYIHRRLGDTDIYFVANRSNAWTDARCTFRVSGKAPELWDPVTAHRRFAVAYTQAAGRTVVPVRLPPYGSIFVVFRENASTHPGTEKNNYADFTPTTKLDGPWTVKFDPQWGGPPSVQFPQLVSWTERPESGIKYYSGTALYTLNFDLPPVLRDRKQPLWIDLGQVRELAEVRLNGQSAGILWAPPFRADISRLVKDTGNLLEIEVVNFWPNRIIGDHFLPPEKRLTKTNVRKLTKETPLMPSGLFGPVTLTTHR